MISEPLSISRPETFMVMNINIIDLLIVKERIYLLTSETLP